MFLVLIIVLYIVLYIIDEKLSVNELGGQRYIEFIFFYQMLLKSMIYNIFCVKLNMNIII